MDQTHVFPARFDSLARISEFCTRAAEEAGLDDHAIYAVQLAVDEAFTNIIDHAYGGEDLGDVECSCHIDEEELTIVFRDSGRPFDPTCVPEPDLCSDLEERTAGGLGLYFMRKMMDEVHFDFSAEAGNVLTMVKRREKAA